jgi:hypothetical protein
MALRGEFGACRGMGINRDSLRIEATSLTLEILTFKI